MNPTRSSDRLADTAALKYWLARRGWSQRDLADALGVGEHLISMVTNARRVLAPEVADAIAKALGVGLDDFSVAVTARVGG